MTSKHGHYSDAFEEEAKRIRQLYKDKLNLDITWVEATAIAARRSSLAILNYSELRKILSQLRGIN